MSEFITINTAKPHEIKNSYEPYELVSENNPILKEKLSQFDFSSGVDVKELVGKLTETLKVNKGFGLAANQCGLRHRVFVMGAEEEYIALFNPEILHYSTENSVMDEGCLSFMFLSFSIKRPKDITVRFQDENGEINELNLTGLSARIAQHEIDHLNGITFDTVVKPLARKNGLKRREKIMKQYARNFVAQRRMQNEISR